MCHHDKHLADRVHHAVIQLELAIHEAVPRRKRVRNPLPAPPLRHTASGMTPDDVVPLGGSDHREDLKLQLALRRGQIDLCLAVNEAAVGRQRRQDFS